MRNIYLFRNRNTYTHPNPYITNLETELSKNFCIVNNGTNKIGVLELFKYFAKTDLYYFNWIENLAQNKFGRLQSIFLFSFLVFSKVFNKKIVWVLHNKYSHSKKRNIWTDFLYGILFKYSNLVITHSEAGVEFANTVNPKCKQKVSYFIHPLLEIIPDKGSLEKEFDFLIWGAIEPYKGVVEFLRYLQNKVEACSFKVLIVGKCSNLEYQKEIFASLAKNVSYYNQFYEIEDIANFARQSRFVLFTYNASSILSSGSLMDSIRMRSIVVGPNTGAFKDLSCNSFVKTYNNYDDLLEIHKNSTAYSPDSRELERFYTDNSWQAFGERLTDKLKLVIA